MKITEKRLDELTLYENNPRKNDDAVEGVAASLSEFGWQQPIVVDKDGVVIVGHTRIKAARKLGLETAPVVVADELTEEQVKAYRLVDNKTAELAGWDFEKLIPELKGIAEINMEAFGFDDGSAEEEKFAEKKDKQEKTPKSRIIVAGVSLFGGGSELLAIKAIDEDESELILDAMDEETATKVCDKIEDALRGLTS